MSAIVTYAVAIACALWSPIRPVKAEVPFTTAFVDEFDPLPRLKDFPLTRGVVWSGFGVEFLAASSDMNYQHERIYFTAIARAGLPFTATHGEYHDLNIWSQLREAQPESTMPLVSDARAGGISFIGTDDRYIPLWPSWIGLCANAILLYAMIVGSVTLVRGSLAMRRRAQGRCGRCGYPRPPGAVLCPECGLGIA